MGAESHAPFRKETSDAEAVVLWILSAKMRSALQAPLCLDRLPRVVDCSAGPSAGENRCAQAGGATDRSERCELEAGLEANLGLRRAWISREQELRTVAGAA